MNKRLNNVNKNISTYRLINTVRFKSQPYELSSILREYV